MPDISMCSNKGCELRRDCYRYLARPDERWQSYTRFIPQEEDCAAKLPVAEYASREIRTLTEADGNH